MEKPIGWNWRSPWWNLEQGEGFIAIIMLFAFLGTLYFLWHGLSASTNKSKALNLFTSCLCFLLLILLGFKEAIITN